MSTLETLDDLFVHELRDVLHAEKQILKALPKMSRTVTAEGVKTAFDEHRQVTEEHVHRLEKISEMIDKPIRAKRCLGMEGLLEEGAELIDKNNDASPAVRDAGLIASAQKVEHYEICAYGTLIAYAKQLGLTDAVALLEKTLTEEKETDKRLTELANEVNFEATHAAH